MLQCLDILVLKVGQIQDVLWLEETSQHTKLRILLPKFSDSLIDNEKNGIKR